MTTKRNKGVLKREPEFKLHSPTYGDHGGGTQEPVYLDKSNNKVPADKTKWAKLKRKNDEKKSTNRRD